MALMHVTGCCFAVKHLGPKQPGCCKTTENGAEMNCRYWLQEQRTSTVNSKRTVRLPKWYGRYRPLATLQFVALAGVIMQYRQLADTSNCW